MASAKANKSTSSGTPMAGSMTPLQPMIKGNGRMVDDRYAPCGDNQLATPDNDGDEY